jgi:predicted nucleotidyltransferase component of viral defense system
MKDHLSALVQAAAPFHARNLAREYLQARILAALQSAGAMMPLAFHGGTALRFLFAIQRYSEDLDFALEQPSPEYDFRRYLRTVQSELRAEGHDLEVKRRRHFGDSQGMCARLESDPVSAHRTLLRTADQ